MSIFIRKAISEALYSYKINEVPVGCVIVKNNKIISHSHNIKEYSNISTNHAEIICINNACKSLNSWRLNDSSIYVTLEPCVMCAGAIFESRVKNLYIGTSNPFNGFFSCNYHCTFPSLNIIWLNDKRCEFIINKFFKKIREQ